MNKILSQILFISLNLEKLSLGKQLVFRKKRKKEFLFQTIRKPRLNWKYCNI